MERQLIALMHCALADGMCRRPVVSRTAAVPDTNKLCRYFVKTGMISSTYRHRCYDCTATPSDILPVLRLSRCPQTRSILLRPFFLSAHSRLTPRRRMRESAHVFLHPRLDENVPLSPLPPQEMSPRFQHLSTFALSLRQQLATMQALSSMYRFAMSLRPHRRRSRCCSLQGFRRDGLVRARSRMQGTTRCWLLGIQRERLLLESEL